MQSVPKKEKEIDRTSYVQTSEIPVNLPNSFPQETKIVHILLVRSNEFRLACTGKHL